MDPLFSSSGDPEDFGWGLIGHKSATCPARVSHALLEFTSSPRDFALIHGGETRYLSISSSADEDYYFWSEAVKRKLQL